MAVFPVKKYKTVKDENSNKIQVQKTKEEWNKETKNGTATWYFVNRYKVHDKVKQYKSALFSLKRDAETDDALFRLDPIKYISEHSKRAKVDVCKINNYSSKNLNDYFEDFFSYKLNFNRESTAYDYKKSWDNHISDFFVDKEITLVTVQEWFEYMNIKQKVDGTFYSTRTKNKVLTALREFCAYLVKKGRLEMNFAEVVGNFENPNENKNEEKEIKFQTEEQFNEFMEVVDDEFWYSLFNFAFWHGPRIGEQRALKIKNINLDKDIIKFSQTFSKSKSGGEKIGPIKNGLVREIALAPQSKPYIEKLIAIYKRMDGYSDEWFLFGGPINTNKNRIERKLIVYYSKLKTIHSDKNINQLSHHEFGRHSHASHLLNKGIENGMYLEEVLSMIATRLGDTIEVIRRTYAHQYEHKNNDKIKDLLKL